MNDKTFLHRLSATIAALPTDQREAFFAMWEEDPDIFIACIHCQGNNGRFYDFEGFQKHFRISRLLYKAATTTEGEQS